jgi:hypothetical protein
MIVSRRFQAPTSPCKPTRSRALDVTSRLIPQLTEFSTTMSFTIVRNLEQLPSYPLLCKLAEQNHVRVTGDEHTGSFSGRNVAGDYEFGEDGINGKFAAYGVTGQFSFEIGKATVTVIEKPFWLPELLLRRKITEGLDMFWNELASWRSS